jgi:phosphoribosylanthranilate isomerase
LRLPVHAQDTSEIKAAQIIKDIGIAHQAVGITYEDRPNAIVDLCLHLGVNKVQLHGQITYSALHKLRDLAPNLSIIKSIVVGRDPVASHPQALGPLVPLVNAFFIDSFDPLTGASGATGQAHDWGQSSRIVKYSPRPVFLAGGLTPENLSKAISQVRPAGVDAHTGLESADGRKDPDLVSSFVRRARRAFASLEVG